MRQLFLNSFFFNGCAHASQEDAGQSSLLSCCVKFMFNSEALATQNDGAEELASCKGAAGALAFAKAGSIT